MRCTRVDAVGVEDGHAEFANRLGRESDSFGDSREKWKQRGLPETLIVNGGVPALRADFSNRFADAGEIAGIDGPDFGGEAAAGDKIYPAGVREPDDFGARERVAQAGDGGKGVDDVAEGAEADDEETRLRHAGPCG